MCRSPDELEFGWQIAIDFEPNADFNERRGCPSHGCPPGFLRYVNSRAKRAFGKQVNRSDIRKTRGFFVGSRLWIGCGRMPVYPKVAEEITVCVGE